MGSRNEIRKGLVPQEAIQGMLQTTTPEQQITDRRALKRENQQYQYLYMTIASLAKEIDTLEPGTKIRVEGYPEFLGSSVEPGDEATIWNFGYGSRAVYRQYGLLGGMVTQRVPQGRSISADVLTSLYKPHPTFNPDDKKGVLFVRKDHVENAFALGATHVGPPEATQYDRMVPLMVMGKVTRTPDGQSALQVDAARTYTSKSV